MRLRRLTPKRATANFYKAIVDYGNIFGWKKLRLASARVFEAVDNDKNLAFLRKEERKAQLGINPYDWTR